MKDSFFSQSKQALAVLRVTGLLLIGAAISGCVGSGEPLSIAPQSLSEVSGENTSALQQLSLAEADSSEGAFADQSNVSAIPTKAPRKNSGEQKIALASSPEPESPTEEKSKAKETKPLSSATPVKEFIKKPTASARMALLSDGIVDRPRRKASFFQRLFRKRTTKPNSVKNTKSRLAPGESALPGVKSNASIFGIGGEDQEIESRVQVASVGGFGRLSPNGLRVQHEKVKVSCFKPELLRVLKMVERKFRKKPIVTSGYRSPRRNRRAGGVSRSQHIYCKAADIQVENVSKWTLAKYLRSIPGRGGVGTYCRTKSVHIDVGSKRDWHHPCRRRSTRKRRKA